MAPSNSNQPNAHLHTPPPPRPRSSSTNTSTLRTPIYNPPSHPSTTTTPGSALRASANMPGDTSEDYSSPLNHSGAGGGGGGGQMDFAAMAAAAAAAGGLGMGMGMGFGGLGGMGGMGGMGMIDPALEGGGSTQSGVGSGSGSGSGAGSGSGSGLNGYGDLVSPTGTGTGATQMQMQSLQLRTRGTGPGTGSGSVGGNASTFGTGTGAGTGMMDPYLFGQGQGQGRGSSLTTSGNQNGRVLNFGTSGSTGNGGNGSTTTGQTSATSTSTSTTFSLPSHSQSNHSNQQTIPPFSGMDMNGFNVPSGGTGEYLGYGGLGQAFDLAQAQQQGKGGEGGEQGKGREGKEKEEVRDVVGWLRETFHYLPPPYTNTSPQVFREALHAQMVKTLPPHIDHPSKDQVAELVREAFPGVKWHDSFENGQPHVAVGLLAKDGSNQANRLPVASKSQGSRHRYSNSCNLTDLAHIATYAHRELTQGSGGNAGEGNYSPTEDGQQLMSPTTGNGYGGQHGTPGGRGSRTGLDDLAMAAALSERSPMAKGRKLGYGDEPAGRNKKRRGNDGNGLMVSAEPGSSREGWQGQGGADWENAVDAEGSETASDDVEVGSYPDPSAVKGKGRRSHGASGSSGGASSPGSMSAMAETTLGRGMSRRSRHPSNAGSQSQNQTSFINTSTRNSQNNNNNSNVSSTGRTKRNIYTNLAVTSQTDPSIKHYKPNFTYHELITHEIKRSSEGRLQLSEIYKRIADRYPYFKLGEPGWQNSIRHNLSLKKCFVRVDRPSEVSDKSGKGGWWTYVAQNDPEGRGARGGKGTGEYRKGTTPSDIASRSASPVDPNKAGAGNSGRIDQGYGGGGGSREPGMMSGVAIDEQDQIAAILSLHKSLNSGNHPHAHNPGGYPHHQHDDGSGNGGYNGAGNGYGHAHGHGHGHPGDVYAGQTLAMAEEASHAHDYGSYKNDTGRAREPKSGYT